MAYVYAQLIAFYVLPNTITAFWAAQSYLSAHHRCCTCSKSDTRIQWEYSHMGAVTYIIYCQKTCTWWVFQCSHLHGIIAFQNNLLEHMAFYFISSIQYATGEFRKQIDYMMLWLFGLITGVDLLWAKDLVLFCCGQTTTVFGVFN